MPLLTHSPLRTADISTLLGRGRPQLMHAYNNDFNQYGDIEVFGAHPD